MKRRPRLPRLPRPLKRAARRIGRGIDGPHCHGCGQPRFAGFYVACPDCGGVTDTQARLSRHWVTVRRRKLVSYV